MKFILHAFIYCILWFILAIITLIPKIIFIIWLVEYDEDAYVRAITNLTTNIVGDPYN